MTDDQIIDDILAREGGFVSHGLDRGGPTNHGITIDTLASWRGHSVTALDVKELGIAEARDIYQTWYIAPFADAPRDLKPLLVDMAVNHGEGQTKILWKRAGNHLTRLVKERIRFYARIVAKRPTQSVFLRAWIDRALSFLPE